MRVFFFFCAVVVRSASDAVGLSVGFGLGKGEVEGEGQECSTLGYLLR